MRQPADAIGAVMACVLRIERGKGEEKKGSEYEGQDGPVDFKSVTIRVRKSNKTRRTDLSNKLCFFFCPIGARMGGQP